MKLAETLSRQPTPSLPAACGVGLRTRGGHVTGRGARTDRHRKDRQVRFAFLATYTTGLSAQGRAQHQPLSAALAEFAGGRRKAQLPSLLTPDPPAHAALRAVGAGDQRLVHLAIEQHPCRLDDQPPGPVDQTQHG